MVQNLGSAKVHEPLQNGLPLFGLVLSVTGTCTYQLTTFLVLILSGKTENEILVEDSFSFVDEILTPDRDLYMASLNVDALLTNMPLDETIDIYVKKFFQNLETLLKIISTNYTHDLLILAPKELFFYI